MTKERFIKLPLSERKKIEKQWKLQKEGLFQEYERKHGRGIPAVNMEKIFNKWLEAQV